MDAYVFDFNNPTQFFQYNQQYSKNIYECYISFKGRELSNHNTISSYIYFLSMTH